MEAKKKNSDHGNPEHTPQMINGQPLRVCQKKNLSHLDSHSFFT